MAIARVQLPDGRIARLQVPDNASPEDVQRFASQQFSNIFGREEAPAVAEEEPETTIGGQVKEALKGLIPGAAGLGETAITGAAALLPDEQERAVRSAVSRVVEPIRETFAPEAGYEEATGRKLGEAIGSTLPFFPLGALGLAGRAAAVGLGVGAGAGEARLRAEEEGATEGERGLATALGVGPGALEALAPIRVLRRFGFGDEAIKEVAGFVPALKRVAAAGGEEALQEASSQVLQNLIEKGVYNPEEAAFGGVGEAAAMGGGAGAVIGAVMELALGRRLRGAAEPAPAEEPPPGEPLALPAPRTAGYKVDRAGNVVPMTEAEAEEGARLSSEFRAMGLGEAEAVAARMRDQREKQFIEGSEEALRKAVADEDAAAAAKDDLRYLRSLPMEQMGLPLEGGGPEAERISDIDLLGPTTEPPGTKYIPAEESLEGLRPRSRAYKEEAKDLGLKLDKKGNLKPNQFTFDIRGVRPSEKDVELPPEPVPEEQTGFFFSSAPIDQLPPRQRVLRTMIESDTRKTFDNLRGRTGLPDSELKRELASLRNEGVIRFVPGKFEWEFTPEGEQSVRSGAGVRTPRPRRGAGLPVQRPRPGKPQTTGPEPGGVAGTGGLPPQTDGRTDQGKAPLSAEERMAIIRRTAQRNLRAKAMEEYNRLLDGLRTQAATAFEEGRITNTGYEDIVNELKKPVPRVQLVTSKLSAASKKPKVAQPKQEAPKTIAKPITPPAVQLREDATDDEIAAYYKRTGGSKAAPKVKKEKPISIKELDEGDAADQFLKAAEEKAAPAASISPAVDEVGEEIAARKIKRQEAIEIAKANAESAFADQTSFRDLDESIGAYSDNVRDTLQEYGLSDYENDAINAYETRIKELIERETKRPKDKIHPKWATDIESVFGGKVVYSDENLALVTAQGVRDGQTKYMGVKRSPNIYTRIDIEQFAGKDFSPEEKQILVKAKQRLVAEDKARFEQNPQGPFAGARSNVVASEGMDPNYTNFLSSLMKSMGLGNIRVFLFHPEDVRGQADKYKLYGTYSSALSAGLNVNEDGSARPYGPDFKDFYISVRPGMSEGRTIEVIAHELGHVIELVAFNNAPKEVQDAIRMEYNAWLVEAKKKKGSDLIRALRNRETAEAQAEGKTPETQLAREDSYWRSFTEWFADNTSKWATTSEKPVGIVEKFFSDLAKKLRELVAKLTGNRFVPAKSVKDFLDAMGPGSADGWIATKSPLDGTPFDELTRYSMTPTEQRESDRRFIDSIGKIPSSLPQAGKDTYDAAANAASNVPGSVRRGLYGMLNAHDLDRMYGKITGGFGKLWKYLNQEGVSLRKRQDEIVDNIQNWQKVLDKYPPAQRDRFYKVMMDTTVEQVEVLDVVDPNRKINWTAKKDSPVFKEFDRLPKDVKEVYKQLRLAYIDYSLGVEKILEQYLTPTEWQKMLNKFNERRLPVYLPLFRTGQYKLTYTDKSGEYVARQFESVRERDIARTEARRNGATDIEESIVGTKEADTLPSSGFFGEVVGALKKAKVSDEVVSSIVNTYLDYLPAKSVLQLSRRREGVAGFSNNVLEAYANVAGSYARRLTNMEFAPKFREAEEEIRTDIASKTDTGELPAKTAEDLILTVNRQMDFIANPSLDNWAAKLSYFSYQMYLGANISTAIVNTLDIPTITLSRLGGKYGFADASAAILKAGSNFFSKQKSPEIAEVIRRGLDSGVLREQQLRDIAEFKNIDSKLERMKAGVERMTNWAFAKSDMFNRETTFLAAYELAKKANKTPAGAFDEKAFAEAERAVYDVYGSSFPKAAPPIMGNGLARTALTFKRFAIVRMNLLVNALKEAGKGESKEVKDAARKEILGYFGTAYVFAGVQGMPVVGALAGLTSVLNGMFGDDDEPYNPDFAIREAIGLFNYKGPVNYLTGVDIASRTGWTGMFWREDPKRMAEVGPVTYTLEQLLGPAYAYAVGVPRAFDYMANEQYGRAFEQLAPRAIGNIHKGIRYATDGAYTANGMPLVDDVNAYNSFMQVFGFRPSDVAEAGEEAGAAKRMESKIFERRNAIIARAALAQMSGDAEGFIAALEEAQSFSASNPTKAITGKVIKGAIERRQKKILDSVNGVRVDPKLANQIYDELGITP